MRLDTQTFQNMKAFLHYRQDCLFKPRPIFLIGNLEKWKADSRLVSDKLLRARADGDDLRYLEEKEEGVYDDKKT